MKSLFFPAEKDLNIVQEEHLPELSGILKQGFDSLNLKVKEYDTFIQSIGQLTIDYAKLIKLSEWQKAFITLQEEIKIRKLSLKPDELESLSKYEELSLLVKKKEQSLKEIMITEEHMKVLYQESVELIQKYVDVSSQITSYRQDFIQRTILDPRIRVEIKQFRNKTNFESQIRNIINNDSAFGEDIEGLKDLCFHGEVLNQLALVKKELLDAHFNDKTSKNIKGHFKNALQKLSTSQVDELELFVPEDDIVVKYKPEGSKGFKSLSTASAGQKTAAILTFLLSFGESPLLLDQPEDDLDNKLVYDLVVKGLRNAKEKRQIIVVTHNANIPVNGDAEYILSMNAVSTPISKTPFGNLK